MTNADTSDQPKRSRRVNVRTVHPGPFGHDVTPMDLPEHVAGQWDDDQWHPRPPGV